MAKKIVNTNLVATLLIVIAVLSYGLIGKAGNLEPTATPGPTMKTLDEVEARIPIPGSSSPIGSYDINNPGSYYLTGDRICSGYGIIVSADNVTIDLNGYQLIGPGSGSAYGVYMRVKDNVEIRNGTVRNFFRGIYESDSSGKNHRVINLRAVSNGRDGIHLKGSGHLVKDCTANDNGISANGDIYGIYAGNGSTVSGNTVRNNGYGASSISIFSIYGIYAGESCTVMNNTTSKNGGAAECFGGPFIYGIFTSTGCTVTGNTSSKNATPISSGIAAGIYIGEYSVVDQNTAYSNNGLNMSNSGTCSYGTNVPQF